MTQKKKKKKKITVSFQKDALTSEMIAQFHKGWAVEGGINYGRVLRFISTEMDYPSFTRVWPW